MVVNISTRCQKQFKWSLLLCKINWTATATLAFATRLILPLDSYLSPKCYRSTTSVSIFLESEKHTREVKKEIFLRFYFLEGGKIVFCYKLRDSTQRAPPFGEMTPGHLLSVSQRFDERYNIFKGLDLRGYLFSPGPKPDRNFFCCGALRRWNLVSMVHNRAINVTLQIWAVKHLARCQWSAHVTCSSHYSNPRSAAFDAHNNMVSLRLKDVFLCPHFARNKATT